MAKLKHVQCSFSSIQNELIKVYAFDRLWNKKYVRNIQDKSLHLPVKANLDEKILRGKT